MHYKQITNMKNKIIFSTTALLNDFQYRVLLKLRIEALIIVVW